VEYKRSSRNTFRHAELQLCAQALCLEEMLGVPVPAGAIYFGAFRRRRDVAMDAALRAEVQAAILGILSLMRENRTPAPEPGPKCEQCSLIDHCMPGLPGPGALDQYLRSLL
jgi:CRISPR-associated exonuclease Cas4